MMKKRFSGHRPSSSASYKIVMKNSVIQINVKTVKNSVIQIKVSYTKDIYSVTNPSEPH